MRCPLLVNKAVTRSHLDLHTLVQRAVHQRVEGQEEGADGVEEGVSVLVVAVEPERWRSSG